MPKKTYQEQMRNSYPDYPMIKPEGFSFVKKGKKNVYWVVENE